MFCVGKYYMRHVALASFFLLSVRSYSLCLFVCGFAAPHLIACHMQIVGQKANGAGLSMICFQHAILNYIYVCRHRHPVHTSRFIHVFCHASPLSLSLSLSTKVTSFILPLFGYYYFTLSSSKLHDIIVPASCIYMSVSLPISILLSLSCSVFVPSSTHAQWGSNTKDSHVLVTSIGVELFFPLVPSLSLLHAPLLGFLLSTAAYRICSLAVTWCCLRGNLSVSLSVSFSSCQLVS